MSTPREASSVITYSDTTEISRDLCRLALGVGTPKGSYSVGQALQWFTRNKYPLMSLPDDIPDWLAFDLVYRDALEQERKWYRAQREQYLQARQAWLDQGIECVMLKSSGHPPSFPHLSDNIDILVRPERALAARDTLRRLGYVELRHIEEPHKHLFRKFHNGQSVSAIHVHEEVGWLVGFMDEDALWSRMWPASDDPAVNIPSAEDAILINLAHACYENKELRLIDVARVRHVLTHVDQEIDWGYMDQVAACRGWIDGLHVMLLVYALWEDRELGESSIPAEQIQRMENAIAKMPFIHAWMSELREMTNIALPLDLSYWFCKRLYYRKILADPATPAAERWKDVGFTLLQGLRLKARLRPQRPFIVSLSGIDGSGKTAHAQMLVDVLRLCEIDARYVWARGGSTGLVGVANRLRRGLRRGKMSADGGDGVDAVTRRRKRFEQPVARFTWSWCVAIDQILTYGVVVRLRALGWKVIVLDRFAYDTAVEMDRSLPPDAHWSRLAIDTMLRFVPRPHAPYVLDISPATAQRRKPDEVWHADLADERQAYRTLADRLRLRLLSTDGTFAESNDVLLREVIMRHMARAETLPGRMLMINPSQKNLPDPYWESGGVQ